MVHTQELPEPKAPTGEDPVIAVIRCEVCGKGFVLRKGFEKVVCSHVLEIMREEQ